MSIGLLHPEYVFEPLQTGLARFALPQPSGWVEIDKEGLALLKLKLDTLFRLMNKVLPDLKAMEFTDITESTSATRDPVTLARQVRGMLAIEDASRVPPTSTRVQ
jgi:hypothetical protein